MKRRGREKEGNQCTWSIGEAGGLGTCPGTERRGGSGSGTRGDEERDLALGTKNEGWVPA